MTTDETIAHVFGIWEQHGQDDYIGEPVSQLEHAAQAAALAEAAGHDEEVVLAAFFHDFGHLCCPEAESMDGYGTVDHEKVGADHLRGLGFPERLCRLIESHVSAKRFLTFKNPAYLGRLSEASLMTLAFQGGPMTPEEAAAFESDPLFPLYLQMRTWDEQAKEEQVPLPDLDRYRAMTRRVLEAAGA
jgi:phosphonate degradation associated HDIG domain protein